MAYLLPAFLSFVSLTTATPLTPRADPVCPTNDYLPAPGSFVWPQLMVPVSAANPDTAYGTVYSPRITPNDFCTIFNLYLPQSAAGKTCSLEFLFPSQDQLRSSSYVFEGPGHFNFTGFALGAGAELDTTWNKQPPAGSSPAAPPAVLAPGNAYVVNRGGCDVQPGQGDLEVSGMLCSNDTTFEYFQNQDLCPIGFYVVIS